MGILHAIEHASLPKHVGCEYNLQHPFCSYSSSQVPVFTKERFNFMGCVFTLIKQRIRSSCRTLQTYFSRWLKPSTTSLALSTLADMTRGKSELLAENALLRHQLIILRRQVKHPVYLKTDRFLLVVLARMVRTWKQALFLVQPETLLRWHRELFRLFTEAQIESTLKQASALVRYHHFDRGRWQQTTDSGELSASVGNS